MSTRGKKNRDTLPRLDATNLAGLTRLMNPQHLNTSADLNSAEKTIMGRQTKKASGSGVSSVDPVEMFTREIRELSDKLDIDFHDDDDNDLAASPEEEPPPPPRGKPQNPLKGSAIDDLIADLDLNMGDASVSDDGGDSDDSGDSGDDSDEVSDGVSAGVSDEVSDGDSDSGSVSSEDDASSETRSVHGARSTRSHRSARSRHNDKETLEGVEASMGINTKRARREARRRKRVTAAAPAPSARRGRAAPVTEEQERRRHINSVMGDMRCETRTSFGVEHERVQDNKAAKLEQIGQLRLTLEEEGINCDGVGSPSMSSSLDEIDSVLNILKLKNDRNRYSTLAEEVILGAAEGIETVLDGSRALPVVGWKPDYRGYHNTVNAKLHRMRFETSQVVGHVIERFNVGPTTRILMELLPSFFLYPRQQSKQRQEPGLYSDPAASAYSEIRRSDMPDSLTSVRDI
jgi:hypothetical protein